jgi:hypothetical protein
VRWGEAVALAARRRGGEQARREADVVQGLQRRLGRLANQVPSRKRAPAAFDEWQRTYAQTSAKAEAEARRLASNVAARSGRPVVVREVCDALPDGAVLVDLLKAREEYVGWVVGKEGRVVWVRLGRTRDVEEAADEFLRAVRVEARGDPA